MHRIDTEAVLSLARAQQQDWVDAAAAERIAAGASAAIAAVSATLGDLKPGLVTPDAEEFSVLLETLAEPPP